LGDVDDLLHRLGRGPVLGLRELLGGEREQEAGELLEAAHPLDGRQGLELDALAADEDEPVLAFLAHAGQAVVLAAQLLELALERADALLGRGPLGWPVGLRAPQRSAEVLRDGPPRSAVHS